jgi:FkbM family methyltransferase
MGLFYKHWTLYEAFVFFLSCVMKKLKVAPDFFNKYYQNVTHHAFKKKWLKNKNGEYYFDFKGALLPDVSINKNELIQLISCFDDVFLIPCFYNDNHDKTIIELLSRQFSKVYWEGPYGYKDGAFNVSVKRDDIVIDAGAWIGDFSAYAASKGAVVYAFEPIEDTFHWLSKTSDLNKGIHPIKKGLSDNEEELNVFIDKNYSAANSIVIERQEATVEEKIYITTIDKFVEKNNITRVDFIKADIEGAERNMLKGAAYVLKKFAPKLAICTYHLHDDPEVLEKIILEANPNYKIVHLEHKLFAAVC